MAETHVNFLGGSPLNRLSWLRTSTPFLSAVLASPEARWVLFKAGEPLVHVQSASNKFSLARLTTSDVRTLLGALPVFGQGQVAGKEAQLLNDNGEPILVLQAIRLHGPTIVFLGLHEPDNGQGSSALPSSDFSPKTDPEVAASNITGTPYFSLDVTDIEKEVVDEVLKNAESAKETGVSLEFTEPRTASGGFTAFDAAVFAEGRSMVDWNVRNKFCPGCGSPTYSLWAGWKLACSTLLPWADNFGKKPCPSAKGLHNYSHPRTDPVVIMAIIDESGDRCLLGRNRKFPAGFYSTLAGFIEPGESFEDAVKREIWEEAGVRVWGVKYHSGQPWPYPASLMVGFYAFADSSQPIRIDLDNELVDARWFTRAEVQAVLTHKLGSVLTKQDQKRFDADEADKDSEKAAAAAVELPPFRVPPPSAIAGVLIRDWASGKIAAGESSAPQKGNL
ncbi:NUDIX hydrolase domain-like protein [Phellopilus nigrolimitatus]|nr:NUDIX hydrolase domain-like protein [Phellopilus nigrolimitatus]